MANILDLPTNRLLGKNVKEVIPASAWLGSKVAQAEISLMTNNSLRHYVMSLSPLKERTGLLLGHLFLLHELTEQKQAQAKLLEQQRAMATLQERERLARELHDNAGQVLGYVSLQAQAIRKWVQDGKTVFAETELVNLANAAQAAHTDLRESILNLKTATTEQWSFQGSLEHHLAVLRENYGIRVEMTAPGWLEENTFLPETGVQLLRVIQEALSNARRHGNARVMRVTFERDEHKVWILIVDDGKGFDPEQVNQESGCHFGLAFMKERMDQIGGQLKITSKPGQGTQVLLEAPVHVRQEAMA